MLFHTHVVIGIILFLLTKDFFSGGREAIFLLLILLGSLLPDLDGPKSKINRWSGIIGRILIFFTRHRGILHSIFFFIVLFFIIFYLWGSFYALGIIIGYFGHILADGLTPMGVRAFYPFSRFKIKGPIRVGSLTEGVLFVGLIIIIILKFI